MTSERWARIEAIVDKQYKFPEWNENNNMNLEVHEQNKDQRTR